MAYNLKEKALAKVTKLHFYTMKNGEKMSKKVDGVVSIPTQKERKNQRRVSTVPMIMGQKEKEKGGHNGLPLG